ncbi:MAG TPA: PD-(D/E)XK nuclease family protein [Aggregatilineales bacterium]|nr:PD-(D/E)XK nuclease family protein [Aggregatilineales bacterium]
MPAELLIAPVGAGKTGHVLDRLAAVIRSEPFARVWVVLPNARQEDAFRERLIQHDPARRVYFNIEFFTFYSLYKHLLDRAGIPQREIDQSARLRLLRELLHQLRDRHQLRLYDRIAEKPGFAHIVADFIDELKQNLITPEQFRAAAQTTKDQDLALIYETYQATLIQHDLVDRDGEGWLALKAVNENTDIATDVSLLLVDGFDQVSPLQARLIALLSGRAAEAVIPMPSAPGRESTVGRRFEEARQQLMQAFIQEGTPYVTRWLKVNQGSRHAALRHLNQSLFLTADPVPSDDRIRFLEAPDPVQESAAVMRQVKRLLLGGAAPDDILIAVRDMSRYGVHLAEAARRYGLPVALHTGDGLAENPAIIALLHVLSLSTTGFRRRDVLDALRSPYLKIEGLDSVAVDLLEAIAQTQLVISGRDEWLSAIDRAGREPEDPDAEQDVLRLEPEQAASLSNHLRQFFDQVTPPNSAYLVAYLRWIEAVIGDDPQSDPEDEREPQRRKENQEETRSLGLLSRAREGQKAALVDRDLAAINQVKRVMKGLLAAQNLLEALALNQTAQVHWQDFHADLARAVQVAAVDRAPKRAGKVLVTTVSDARGLPHQHLLIPGLSEGIFPAPTPENLVYLDSERSAFREHDLRLETSAERSADDGLFYGLISQARETLTLSRPTLQNGVPWPESSLWRAVRILYSDSDTQIESYRLRPGAVVPVSDVAHDAEAVLALAEEFTAEEQRGRGTEGDLTQRGKGAEKQGRQVAFSEISGLYNFLIEHRDAVWENVRRGQQIESRRMSRTPHDHYSGRLRSADLIVAVAAQLGSGRVWSASQFNDLGQCGFRFFSKRLLKLDALEQPEDGLDAARRGTLIHAILENTYQAMLGLPILPENQEQAIQTLRSVAAVEMQQAPAKLGFRASPIWEQEKDTLLRKLEAIVRLDFSEKAPSIKPFGDEPRTPYRLEQPFGDDASLRLTAESEPLRVTGYIDRIDRQGNRIILTDYKSGSTPIKTEEMQRGRNYQMMLYLLAAGDVLEQDDSANRPTQLAGGYFWHISNQKVSGVFEWEKDLDRAALDDARQHLARQIDLARAGDFAAEPNKSVHGACSHYCEYTRFCRVRVMKRGKA